MCNSNSYRNPFSVTGKILAHIRITYSPFVPQLSNFVIKGEFEKSISKFILNFILSFFMGKVSQTA